MSWPAFFSITKFKVLFTLCMLCFRSKPCSLMLPFDSEVSDPKMENTDIVRELTKTRSMTSMLKGRVSSLFFSRTNKSSKQKSSNPRDKIESAELPRHPSGHDVDIDFEGELPDLLGSSNEASPSHSFSVETKSGLVHTKAESSATKPCPSRNPFENQEQPRLFSVLETPFQEEDHMELEFSDNFSLHQMGLIYLRILVNPI